MAKVSGVHKSYGTIIRISGDMIETDLISLEKLFEKLIEKNKLVYLDLGRMETGNHHILDQFFLSIKRYAANGLHLTLIQANPEIRKSIRSQHLDQYISLSDFLDEAIFPEKMGICPQVDAIIDESPRIEMCPSCGNPLPLGNPECAQCGFSVIPRRSTRHTLSIPFLYGLLYGGEFLDSEWNGAVTEELDIKKFSGIGFFSQKKIGQGKSLYFLFPTLRWDTMPKKEISVLPIFHGRVKHCTQSGDWYRMGVALSDIYEYSGRFNIKSETEF